MSQLWQKQGEISTCHQGIVAFFFFGLVFGCLDRRGCEPTRWVYVVPGYFAGTFAGEWMGEK